MRQCSVLCAQVERESKSEKLGPDKTDTGIYSTNSFYHDFSDAYYVHFSIRRRMIEMHSVEEKELSFVKNNLHQ